jgi:hypothetical protein
LSRAAHIALQHGAILVAECANRFIRHPAYAGKAWLDNVAREVELDELRFYTDGLPLATLLALEGPTRGELIKRGQTCKGNHGGRPCTQKPGELKRRREANLPEVLRRHEAGDSYGAIAKALKLPKQTVSDWCRTVFS